MKLTKKEQKQWAKDYVLATIINTHQSMNWALYTDDEHVELNRAFLEIRATLDS